MARSSAARAFGFRTPGLLRILIAADPQELLKALEEIGIKEPEENFLDLILIAGRALFAPLDLFLSGVETARENFRIIITAAEADLAPGRGGAGAIVVETQNDVNDLRRFFSDLDRGIAGMREEVDEAEKLLQAGEQQTKEDIGLTFL